MDKLPQCKFDLRLQGAVQGFGFGVRVTCASRVRTVSMPGTCQISTATLRRSRWANSSTCPLTPCLKQQDATVKTSAHWYARQTPARDMAVVAPHRCLSQQHTASTLSHTSNVTYILKPPMSACCMYHSHQQQHKSSLVCRTQRIIFHSPSTIDSHGKGKCMHTLGGT